MQRRSRRGSGRKESSSRFWRSVGSNWRPSNSRQRSPRPTPSHQHREAARITATLEVSRGVVLGGGDSSSCISSGWASSLSLLYAAELLGLMQRPRMVVLVADVAEAAGGVAVHGLALTATNIISFQVALSTAAPASLVATVCRIATARVMLAVYFGRALHVEDGDDGSSSRSYRAGPAVVCTLHDGEILIDWLQPARRPVPRVALRSDRRLGRQCSDRPCASSACALSLGFCSTALGYAGVPESPSTALSGVSGILVRAPTCAGGIATAAEFSELVLAGVEGEWNADCVERIEGEDVVLSYSDGSLREAGTFGSGT